MTIPCPHLGPATNQSREYRACARKGQFGVLHLCTLHKKLCSPGPQTKGDALWCEACPDNPVVAGRGVVVKPGSVTKPLAAPPPRPGRPHTGHIGPPEVPCVLCNRPAMLHPAVRLNLGAPALPAPPRDFLPGVRDPIPDLPSSPVPDGWACRPDVRDRHVWAFRKIQTLTFPPPEKASGEGIVYVGGGRYWPMVVLALRMARRVTSLPIQVWHRGRSEPVDPADVADLPGITFHDSSAALPAPRVLGGWEAKAVAMLGCGWERFLFLDADAYLVGDPRPLLDMATHHTPLVYWEDMPGNNLKLGWHWYGIDPARGQRVPVIQGGQVAIHRTAAWRELCLYHWLNQHSDYTYHCPNDRPEERHGFGDQDQLRVTWAATGKPFHCFGEAPWVHPAFVCPVGGKSVVIHRCQGKVWGNGLDARTAHLPGDREFFAALDAYLLGDGTAGEVFGRVYRRGIWGAGTRSGKGSTPAEAGPYIEAVNTLVKLAGWRSVVDLGCGDGYIASRIEAESVTGVDCYGPHVEALRAAYPDRTWLELDLDRDRESLPAGDVALVKDILQHWSTKLVLEWLAWAKASGKWRTIIITNDRYQNDHDCLLGGYRGLDRSKAPLDQVAGLRWLCDYLHKSILVLDNLGRGDERV